MAKNTEAIPSKTTGSSYAASEFEVLRGFVDTPIQPLTAFTDTDIIVDGTKSYSTIKAITAATHTITANATPANHIEGNYLTVRYSFSQDCTLTLENFDTVGNKTGTIDPIVAGTYDFYFVASAFGVNLLVKSNTQTSQTQLASPSNFQASAGDTEVDLSWSAVTNATGYVLEFHDGDVLWAAVPAYDGTSTSYNHTSLSNGTQYFYRLKATASGYIDSPEVTANATPSAGITQLTAPTLTLATPSNAQVTLNFTNPNSGNEDDNLIQFKLDTEPTTWTNGVVLATSATTGIQTGLTNDLLYNFRIIARGSGAYSNSDPSNELDATPAALAAFVPTDLGAKLLFFGDDARVLANSTNDGSTVSAWTDKSTNADDLVTPTPGDEPDYSATKGLLFNGTTHDLSNDLTKNEALEFFIVCSVETYKNLGQVLKLQKTGADEAALRVGSGSSDISFTFANLSDASNVTGGVSGKGEGEKIFLACEIKGADSVMYYDGVASGASTPVTIVDFDKMWLPSQGGLRLNEGVLSLAVTSTLTSGERSDMFGFFNAL